jgi:hypothetical protein
MQPPKQSFTGRAREVLLINLLGLKQVRAYQKDDIKKNTKAKGLSPEAGHRRSLINHRPLVAPDLQLV